MISGICRLSTPEAIEQFAVAGRVVRLAGAQAEAEDLFETRGNQMNLGVEPATAAADGLKVPFLSAPMVSGCTLMLVPSRLMTSILTRSRLSICNSSNTRAGTRALAQRLMRV